MDAVIVISGRIASGKTTFAETLAKELGVAKTGFGDEVKARAEAQGRPGTREVWQEMGAELVAHQPEQFCRAVLARGNFFPGTGIVIDGIRHIEILDLLRTLVAPQRVIHLHVESPDALRQTRAEERKRSGEIDLSKADQHSTEIQVVEKLPSAADVLVDGTQEVGAMVGLAVQAIRVKSK